MRQTRAASAPASTVLTALCVLTFSVTGAASQVDQAGALAFTAAHDYQVLVDGEELEKATLYAGRQSAGMLILASELGGATFARFADKKVVAVDPTKIHIRGDALAVDRNGAFGQVLTDWKIDGGAAQFTLDGKTVRLQPRPIFVGEGTVEDVLEHSPNYRDMMARYTPDAGALTYIRQYDQPLDIEVYFGSWCGVCKQYLPQFLRTVTAGANPRINVRLVGLPRGFGSDPLAKEKNIKGIPCVIVLKDGEEIGRIEGRPIQSYEKDLGGLLRLAATRG